MLDEQPMLTQEIFYTPSALLQLVNNALSPSATKKMIRLKGIYQPGKGTAYGGNYYDIVRDEASDAQLTLVVPALMRPHLQPGKTIEFWGYITRRTVPSGGRIEIHANVSQLVAQTANQYGEKERRALDIRTRKASLGFRDVDAHIKTRIIQEQRISITILVGRSAIIDSDIKHALEEAIGFYQIRFERISFTSESEILKALDTFNDNGIQDILVIARGGGENMDIFNSPAIAEACLDLQPLLVSAIGHKEDVTLVQQIADKAFITPTDLGQYLRRIYNDTIAEVENSKALYTAAIRTQFEATYGRQIEGLQSQLKSLREVNGKETLLHTEEVKVIREQMEMLGAQRAELELSSKEMRDLAIAQETRAREQEFQARELASAISRMRRSRWVIVLIAAIFGLLLGWLAGKR